MCAQAERGERENKLNFKLINAFFYDNSPWKIIHKKWSLEFTTQRKRARSKQARWRVSHTHRASYTSRERISMLKILHSWIHSRVCCIVWRVTSSFNKFRTFLLAIPSSSGIPVTICVCTLRLFTWDRSWSARVGSFFGIYCACRYSSYIAPHRQLTARFIMLIYIYIGWLLAC